MSALMSTEYIGEHRLPEPTFCVRPDLHVVETTTPPTVLTVDGTEMSNVSGPLNRRLQPSIPTLGTLRTGPQGEDHGGLLYICERLHAMILGRDAERLLAGNGAALPLRASMLVLPSWLWAEPGVSLGAKARKVRRVPLRVRWAGDRVLHLREPHSDLALTWTAKGLGRDFTGERLWGETEGDLLGRRALFDALTELVEAAAISRWELLTWIEPQVERELKRAHSALSMEIDGGKGAQRLLDRTMLATVRDRMLLGEEDAHGRKHPGQVQQILDRCLKPDTFRRVEPMRYIKDALRRDANAAVRRVLGDPHIGRQIRRVALGHGVTNGSDLTSLNEAQMSDLIADCRTACPYDPPDRGRVVAALTVAPDMAVRTLSLEGLMDGEAVAWYPLNAGCRTYDPHASANDETGIEADDPTQHGAEVLAAADLLLDRLIDNPEVDQEAGVTRADRDQMISVLRRLRAEGDIDGLRLYLGPWVKTAVEARHGAEHREAS
jgi:hypothetical protein